MNKYIVIGIAVFGLIAGGVLYKVVLAPKAKTPTSTGTIKNIKIVAVKDGWRFDPETIVVNKGDRVIAEVINEDIYDHGIAIDAFGVSQRMPAKGTIKVEFVAVKEGDYPFYCSVPCGEGDVNGKHRTHFDMIGTLKVKPL